MASDVCNTLSPNPSPSMGRGMADQDPSHKSQANPIELISEGKYSIEAVCIESQMSILELAAHVCTAQNLETLARVKQLHAIEREMLLGKLKRDALVRLAELTDEMPVAGSSAKH